VVNCWDKSNYTQFLLIQNNINSLTQVSFHLEITHFGLGPDHQQAKKYTITKRQVKKSNK